MKQIITTTIIMIVCFGVKAQDTICYQNVWSSYISRDLPKDICVKKDETIYTLFNKFDFNRDGLEDIAIKVGKSNRENGDIRIFTIYKQNIDSTYTR